VHLFLQPSKAFQSNRAIQEQWQPSPHFHFQARIPFIRTFLHIIFRLALFVICSICNLVLSVCPIKAFDVNSLVLGVDLQGCFLEDRTDCITNNNRVS
jgi:hypothetical protein